MKQNEEYEPISFSKFSQLFFVSLIGANRKIEGLIKKYFEKFGLHIDGNEFYYYEYLLTKPYKKNGNNLRDYWFFAPFLPRLSKKTNVVYDIAQRRNKFAKRSELLVNYHIANVNEGLWINKMIEFWQSDIFTTKCEITQQDSGKAFYTDTDCNEYKIDFKNEADKVLQNHPPLSPRKFLYGDGKYFFIVVPEYSVMWASTNYKVDDNKIKNLMATNNGDWRKKISLLSRNFEHAFRLGCLHDLDDSVSVSTLVIPLATETFFYGELIISFPNMTSRESEQHICRLAEAIYPIILDYYLPAVIITHEHFYEDNEIYNRKVFLKPEGFDEILNEFDNDKKKSFEYCVPWDTTEYFKNTTISSKASKIENHLNKLWVKIHSQNELLKKNKIKEHLALRKYLITSPLMLELFLQLLDTADNLQFPSKKNSNLPSILVIGKPGSGKDTIPNLIRAFSLNEKGFFGAPIYKINMAAIKPDALIGPLLSGVKLKVGHFVGLNFSGILGEVAKKSINHPVILVLDELNSLHIDLQGILLRFLENSEVVPLGQIEDYNNQPIKCLVIGIMNEDPDKLSREKAMKFVEEGDYLGGIVKDVLYEQFIKLRRLRPDLMYRLKRGGAFYLRNLENRRDDIPILFYIFIREEIEADQEKKDCAIILEIDLLEELLSEHINWSGNVRQLQSLSKKVVSLVKKNSINGDKTLRIYKEDLKQAMILLNNPEND